MLSFFFFFFQAEDGIRDKLVTGVQTCALPILSSPQGHSCLTENSSFQARPAGETRCSSSVPTSVTCDRRWTGSTSPALPSAAGSVVSMGGSSSRSSTASTTAPGASSRRALEAKQRNEAGSPTTTPTSSCGRSTVLPSSIPNGARQTARTGGANPGTAGVAASTPT